MSNSIYICDKCPKSFTSHSALWGHKRVHSPKYHKKPVINHVKSFSGFLDNKYTKLYFKIIENSKTKEYTGYCETHHIIPRSLGGSNDKENLIKFSSREHFICHYLLTKMVDSNSNNWYKMLKALMSMKQSSTGKRYVNSKLYEKNRIKFSIAQSKSQSGSNNSQFNTTWVANLNLRCNKKIHNDHLSQYLEEGWIKKKVFDFDKFKTESNDQVKIPNLIKPIIDKEALMVKQRMEITKLYEEFLEHKSTNPKGSLRTFAKYKGDRSHVSYYNWFKKFGFI